MTTTRRTMALLMALVTCAGTVGSIAVACVARDASGTATAAASWRRLETNAATATTATATVVRSKSLEAATVEARDDAPLNASVDDARSSYGVVTTDATETAASGGGEETREDAGNDGRDANGKWTRVLEGEQHVGFPVTKVWRTDVVPSVAYVVTWCCGNGVEHFAKRFAGLSRKTLGIVLVAKTPESRCEKVSDDVWKHVWMCAEMPNSQGREVPAMAWYAREAYDELPPVSIFTHDDKILHATLRSFLTELKSAENDEASVEAFVRERVTDMEREWRGGERSPTNITAETFVAERVIKEPLIPSYEYTHMFSLLLTTFFEDIGKCASASELEDVASRRDEFPGWRLSRCELGETLFWPLSANFAVTRDMLHIRTRSFYDAILRLTSCDGKLTSHDFQYLGALEWAHGFERAWMPIAFNPRLKERPADEYECVLDPTSRCFELLDWSKGARSPVRYDAERFGASVAFVSATRADARGLRFPTDPHHLARVIDCHGDTWHDHALPSSKPSLAER